MKYKTQEEIKEATIRDSYYINADIAYKDFCRIVENGDNKQIEETKVFKVLDFIASNRNELEEKIKIDKTLYRARIVNQLEDLPIVDKEQEVYNGFDKYGSKEPPLHMACEGRCNSVSTSYLYLAEEKHTACAEVKPACTQIISLAQYKTNKELNIVDFSTDKKLDSLKDFGVRLNISIGQLITHIMLQFYGSYGFYRNYKITQYICDFFNKAGFDGVAYASAQTGGKCYALFRTNSRFIEFIDSKLVRTESIIFRFTEYDTGLRLNNKTDEEDSSEAIEKDKKYILNKRMELSRKNKNG